MTRFIKLVVSMLAMEVGDWARRRWRRWRVAATDRTDPIPLTHREVEHIQSQIRSASRPSRDTDRLPSPPRVPRF